MFLHNTFSHKMDGNRLKICKQSIKNTEKLHPLAIKIQFFQEQNLSLLQQQYYPKINE